MSINIPGDDKLVAVFKHHAIKDEAASKKEGRPIYNDIEIVEIRKPGSINSTAQPSMMISHWSDSFDGPVPVTYAERFSPQYRQFKMQQAQTKSGTPLLEVPFLTEARRAELRALNIYTAEQLAAIDGQELKNIGMFGRELKNKAQEYINESKTNAPNLALAAELEALQAKNAILEEDLELVRQKVNGVPDKDEQFDTMTLEQLRDYVSAQTGHPPHGNLQRKTLVRMAIDARPQKAA